MCSSDLPRLVLARDGAGRWNYADLSAARRGIGGVEHVQNTLILTPVVTREEQPSAFGARHAGALVVPNFGEPRAQALALRQIFEPRLRECVLCSHEFLGRRCAQIFERAIRISDGRTVIDVDHLAAGDGRIGEPLRAATRAERHDERYDAEGARKALQAVAMMHDPL